MTEDREGARHRKVYIQVSQIPETNMLQDDVPKSEDFPYLAISRAHCLLNMKTAGGCGLGCGCGGLAQMSPANPYRA